MAVSTILPGCLSRQKKLELPLQLRMLEEVEVVVAGIKTGLGWMVVVFWGENTGAGGAGAEVDGGGGGGLDEGGGGGGGWLTAAPSVQSPG